MTHLGPFSLFDTEPGRWSLTLEAGTTPVEDAIFDLHHEPNGYFWEGVARWLIATTHPKLEDRVELDPEAGMFCAYGSDRDALEALAKAMLPITTDAEALRSLVEAASAAGHDFDD